jgi:hypothetical protein
MADKVESGKHREYSDLEVLKYMLSLSRDENLRRWFGF